MGRIQAKPGSWSKIAIFSTYLYFLAALALRSRNAISSGVNGAAPPSPLCPPAPPFSPLQKKQPEKGFTPPHPVTSKVLF